MKTVWIAVFLFPLLSILCAAQDSPEYRKCNRVARTQFDMNACAASEFKRVDDELNRLYAQLLASVKSDPRTTQKVRSAEKAWLDYRDAYIEAMYPAEDKQVEYGSIYPMEVNLLQAKLTRQQIDALKEILKQNSPDGPAK